MIREKRPYLSRKKKTLKPKSAETFQLVRLVDASPQKILEAKMRALEAQFVRPIFNDSDYQLKRQTEIALGDVYKEIMKKTVKML